MKIKLTNYCHVCDKEKLVAVDVDNCISFSFDHWNDLIHTASFPIPNNFKVCGQTFQVKCPTCGSNRNFRATVED